MNRIPSVLAMRRRALALAWILLSGCAGTTQFQSYPGLDASKGTAMVHVARANRFTGAALVAPVYVDRYLVGRLGPGGKITTPVPVGEVHITSTASDAVINAERGAEYFFEVIGRFEPWILNTPPFDITSISRERATELGVE